MNDRYDRKVVRSRHNAFSLGLNMLVAVIGLASLYKLADLVVARQSSIMDVAMLGFLVVLGIGGGLTGLTSRYCVSLDGLHAASLWGRGFSPWDKVTEIRFQTNYFGKYSVQLFLEAPQRKRVHLMLGLLGNDHLLGKAIHEAGSLANPAIRFTGAHHYGPPPYGIFTARKEDA